MPSHYYCSMAYCTCACTNGFHGYRLCVGGRSTNGCHGYRLSLCCSCQNSDKQEDEVVQSSSTSSELRADTNRRVLMQIQSIFGHLLEGKTQFHVPKGFWRDFRLPRQPLPRLRLVLWFHLRVVTMFIYCKHNYYGFL